MKTPSNRLHDDRGDVLMEYVLVTTAIVVPLVVVAPALFDPAGASSGQFGYVGQMFVEWYQRILCGIALPIP